MANRVSLKRLYNMNKTSNTPFLGTTETLETLPFMAEYLTYFAKIDRHFVRNHKSWCPTYNLQDEDTEADVLDAWKDNIDDFLITNKETYTRMWNLFITEYKPLENYDRHEHITDQHSGIDQNTDDIASRVNTSNYGKISGTNTYGEVNNKDNIGTQNGDITNKKAGFNSTTFVDTDAQHNVNGAREDLHHEDSKIDKNEVAARTDKNTTDAYTDIHETNYGHKIEHTNETHGNIGVTTSQQMAQSEVDFWSAYNFYKVILNDIIRSLCNLFDDAPDAFSFDYGDSIKVDPVISGGDKPTPVEKFYKLTVIDKYLSNNKLVTYDTVERSVEEMKEGSAYSVNALTIDGYSTDTTTLTGTITEDTTITFTYTANANLTKVTINVYDKYGDFLQLRETKEYDIGSQYNYSSYLYPVGFEKTIDAISGIAYVNNQNVLIPYKKRERNNYNVDSLLKKIGINHTLFELCTNAVTIFGNSSGRGQCGITGFINLLLSYYNTGMCDTVYITKNCQPNDQSDKTSGLIGTMYSFMLPMSSNNKTGVSYTYIVTEGDITYTIKVGTDKPSNNSIYSPGGNEPFKLNRNGGVVQFLFPSTKGWNENTYYLCFNVVVLNCEGLDIATNVNERWDNVSGTWISQGNREGSFFCGHSGNVIETSVLRL